MSATSPLARLPSRAHAGPALAFFIALALCSIYFYVNRDVAFRGDAWEIWEVARNYYDAGRKESFVEYRGPAIFMLFHELHRVARGLGVDDVTVFRAFSALLFAFITTVLMPAIAGRLAGAPARATHRVVFSAVMLYFFGGYFLHPQVDFLAFALFGTSIALVSARTTTRRGYFATAALTGLFFVGAVLARFNYIVAAPAIVALMVGYPAMAPSPWRARALAVAIFLAPALAALVGAPAQPTQTPTPQQRVLRMQLTVGLKVQKIEWNAGDPRAPGAIEVPDPAGIRLLDAITPPGWPVDRPYWLSPRTYLLAVAENPGAFTVIWAKHFFNGLNLWYGHVYVPDLESGRRLRAALNFVFLLAGALVAWRATRRDPSLMRPNVLLLVAIALPALSATPFVIEVRFFIPLLVLGHALATFGAGDALRMLRRPAVLLPVAAALAAGVLLSEHTWRSAGLQTLLQG